MTEPYSPVPAAAPATRSSKGCLAKGLMVLGGAAVLVVGLGITMLLLSRGQFDKLKPEALRIANEFGVCAVAADRACMRRLSTWDDANLEKALRLVHAVNTRLGKRGAAKLEKESLRYMRNASAGMSSPRWRVEFLLQVSYENDTKAHEQFILEDRGQGLKVARLNWLSDQMLGL